MLSGTRGASAQDLHLNHDYIDTPQKKPFCLVSSDALAGHMITPFTFVASYASESKASETGDCLMCPEPGDVANLITSSVTPSPSDLPQRVSFTM